MKNILFINACVRENSRTLNLAKHLLSNLDGEITEIKLEEEKIKPLSKESLSERDKAINNNDFENDIFKYASQFKNADEIIIAAPFWDLSFPALLKVYFENITVCGITFCYNSHGIPKGLCKARKMHIVMTSGGPCITNFGIDYISALAKTFYGIEDIKTYTAEGLDIFGNDTEKIIKETKKQIDKDFE